LIQISTIFDQLAVGLLFWVTLYVCLPTWYSDVFESR